MAGSEKPRRKRRKMPGPFRKSVPRVEKGIGAVLLVLLAGFAVLLAWKSGKVDAAVFEPVAPEPRARGLLNTILEVPKVRLVGEGATRAPHEARRSSLEDLASRLPARLPSTGHERKGDMELFSEQRLFEKIDGRAELYLYYGNVGLAFTSYGSKEKKEAADVFLYLMKSPLRAFGAFAAERRAGVAEAGVAEESYEEGSTVFFRKGAVYGQVLGGEDWTGAECRTLALEIAGLLPQAAKTGDLAKALKRFPSEDQIPGSARYEPSAAFGYDALSEVFSAKYGQGEGQPSAFLWFSLCKDEEVAAAMRKGFLGGLGPRAEFLPEPGNEDLADAAFVRVGGRVLCIFRFEKLVGGVMDARDRRTCESLCDRLMTAIDRVDEGDYEESRDR